jgi:hypothetical protein
MVMDSQWYFEDHGRAKGPISAGDLLAKVQSGELALIDLVFKEGGEDWQPIEKFSEIMDLLGTLSTKSDASWVVLRVVEVDGREKYEQIGPFTVDQVLELIDCGRIKFNDFVWKEGFETWVPLGKLDKFDKPLASSVEVDKSLYKTPQLMDLEPQSVGVKNYNPTHKVAELREEKPPQGAVGPDLAQPDWVLDLKKQKAVNLSPEPIERPQRPRKEEKKPARAVEPGTEQRIKNEAFDLGEPSEIRQVAPAKIKRRDEPQAVQAVMPPAVEVKQAPIIKHQVKKEENLVKAEAGLGIHSKQTWGREQTQTSSVAAAVVTNVVKKELPKKVEAPPAPSIEEVLPDVEVIKKAQNRWNQVVASIAVIAIVAGVAIFGFWGKKYYTESANESIVFQEPTTQVIREVTPPKPIGEARPEVVQIKPVPAPMPKNTVMPSARETAHLPPPDLAPPITKKQVVETKKPNVKAVPVAANEVTKNIENDVAKMSSKRQSFFHQKERMFLFYNSQQGQSLASDLQKAMQKKNKTISGWKRFYSFWQSTERKLASKISKEASHAKIHGKLFKSLKTAMSQLDARGKELNSQVLSGRNPTKALSVNDIIADFKKINANAKSLDR